MNEFDLLIKNSINEQVCSDNIDVDKSYSDLEAKLLNSEGNKIKTYRFNYMSFKKTVAISMCSLLCVCTVLISTSATIRAVALNALDTVKMIFVQDDDTGEIVQKPANEVLVNYKVGEITTLNDNEISKKLGFKIRFPEQVGNSTFGYKYLGISFEKQLPCELNLGIQQQMVKATQNDEALARISEYLPYRTTSGAYLKDNRTLIISCLPSKYLKMNSDKNISVEDVKIGNFIGMWINYVIPEYPAKSVSEKIYSTDLTAKPTLKEYYKLVWETNGIAYKVGTGINEDPLTKSEAIEFAKDFMATQK